MRGLAGVHFPPHAFASHIEQDQAGASHILLSTAVDLRTHQPPCDGAYQIGDLAKDRVARPDMLEQQHTAGWPYHTQHLAQASNRIVDGAEDAGRDDRVERAVRKRQSFDVALHECSFATFLC